MKTIEELTAGSRAWYSSNDEEVWSGGPYATREEAEAEAEANEHRMICEAEKKPIQVSLQFDRDTFFEAAEESLWDQCNEDGDPLLDFTLEVQNDLQKRVREAIDAWQVAHQLSPMPWRFEYTSDPEIAAWAKAELAALVDAKAEEEVARNKLNACHSSEGF
ncbi:hypothetical protein [Paracoccus sp. SY]|uniref:hypothetical protein n=1 Tax=Paracoccus sp. SY TaxID=1330255 RepID=UPI000CD1362D|nr:hypothetical protein [Paracoccus sp. SY]